MVTFHSLLSLLVLAALHGGISRAAECHGKVGFYITEIYSNLDRQKLDDTSSTSTIIFLHCSLILMPSPTWILSKPIPQSSSNKLRMGSCTALEVEKTLYTLCMYGVCDNDLCMMPPNKFINRYSTWDGICTRPADAGESKEHDECCMELPRRSSGMHNVRLQCLIYLTQLISWEK